MQPNPPEEELETIPPPDPDPDFSDPCEIEFNDYEDEEDD